LTHADEEYDASEKLPEQDRVYRGAFGYSGRNTTNRGPQNDPTRDSEEAEDDAYAAVPAGHVEALPLEARHDCSDVSAHNCHESTEVVEGDGAVCGCGSGSVKRPNKHDADAVDERENEGNRAQCSRKEPQQQDAGDEEQHSLDDEPGIHDVVEW